MAYLWPDNGFELDSIIESIAISGDNGHIRLDSLPDYLFAKHPGLDTASSLLLASLTFTAVEKEATIHATRVTSGHVQEMSQLLNIGRTTLQCKMKQYGIDASQFERRHLDQFLQLSPSETVRPIVGRCNAWVHRVTPAFCSLR